MQFSRIIPILSILWILKSYRNGKAITTCIGLMGLYEGKPLMGYFEKN
jgi:hypothetical protein